MLIFLIYPFALEAQYHSVTTLLKVNETDSCISDFTARYSEGRVYLLATMNNIFKDRYYLVERSVDGNSYKAIGDIKCHGSATTSDIMYSFTDENPEYTYLYYRLVYYTDLNDSVFSETKGVLAGNDDSNFYVTMDNDIWVMNRKNENMIPFKMDFNTEQTECHAFLNSDGNTLYFASDRDGGYGHKDIWACEKLSNGSWSRPYNLGSEVNSEVDEDFPVILGDGVTLFFSRKDTLEGQDYSAFFSTQGDQGYWSESESVDVLSSERKDYYAVNTDVLLNRPCVYHVLKGYDISDAPPVQKGASK